MAGFFFEFECIRTESRDHDAPRRYELLYTPHIANVELWKTSGHFDFYADGMFDQMDVASCVEITFRTPHAMTRRRPRDGVAIPRHRRDVLPVTA